MSAQPCTPNVTYIQLVRYLSGQEQTSSATVVGGLATFLPTLETRTIAIPTTADMALTVCYGVISAAMVLIEHSEFEMDDTGVIGPKKSAREVAKALEFPVFGVFGYRGVFRSADPPKREGDPEPVPWRDVPRQFHRAIHGVMTGFSNPSVSPVMIAARLAHDIVRIQPYPYGNERMARLLLTWVLMVADHGELPLVLRQASYNRALVGPNARGFFDVLHDPKIVEWQSQWTPHSVQPG